MTKEDKQKEKQDRLAQALRNNLKRRKQQSGTQQNRKAPDDGTKGEKD
ncbi:hypothetical protein MNBD_ALPHA02-118 [hydrothermal vent metagenome]|uniref:Uncharacterized protein n=1 Tax=hydrothermal vent metagenome TaxID=652676 RepID=A0A3B0R4Q8_9ZZZZ